MAVFGVKQMCIRDRVKEPGILLTGLTIKAQVSGSITGQARTGQAKVASGLKELIAGTDYLAQLDDNGKLVVTLLSKGDAYEVSEIQVTAKPVSYTHLEAKDVIFYFTKKRPSQIRELSDAAPTITRIRDANEFMTAVAIKAVSYTHLDVYKRQSLRIHKTRVLFQQSTAAQHCGAY